MADNLLVTVDEELLQHILQGARNLHPKETIMLLRGKTRKEVVELTELVIPPFATYGQGFALVPLHMLPTDFSIMGVVHSHPSGSLAPSPADLNHFFGKILMIVGFPYLNAGNVAAYDRNARKVVLQTTKR